MKSKISIGFFGNTCNNLYQISKSIRANSDIDAHLYIDVRSDPQQLPESDDPLLLNNYPDWIHKGKYITAQTVVAPWKSPIVSLLEKHDLNIISHFGPLFSQFTSKPTVFYSAGADLTVHPFALSFINLYYHTLHDKIGALFMSFWQRRGLKKCAEIWTQPFFPFMNAIKKLNIPETKVPKKYFPIAFDTKSFKRNTEINKTPNTTTKNILQNHDFIIFHPSRLMIKDNKKLRESGNWKHNDLLFKGFANFLKMNPKSKAVLLLIDRPASEDIPIAKKNIADLKIDKNVIWLKPPRIFGFTRNELLDLYSISHVVCDDFGVGWFGSIVVEGLCTGCVVLTYVDESIMKQLYPWHPIISVSSEIDICNSLSQLYHDSNYRNNIASKGVLWVEEFHSIKRINEIYMESINDLLSRFGFNN